MKIIDVFWLGLIPTSIDRIIKSTCSHSHFLYHTPDIASCKVLSNDCLATWKELQDIIMAKAIGIHRIIGSIIKEKEKAYRKKYNMVKGTYMDPIFREEMSRKRKVVHIFIQAAENVKTENIVATNNPVDRPNKVL